MGQVATTESNLFYYSKRLSSLTENMVHLWRNCQNELSNY